MLMEGQGTLAWKAHYNHLGSAKLFLLLKFSVLLVLQDALEV